MNEHGAASSLDARAQVVVDFHNEIIEMIFPPHVLATIFAGQFDVTVVGSGSGGVAPAVRPPQWGDREGGNGSLNPIGPVEYLAGAEASLGRYAVTFSFQRLRPQAASADYAWKAHETCNQGCAFGITWSLINNDARNFFHAGRLE